MAIMLGTTAVKSIMLGSTAISRVYLGDAMVYQANTGPALGIGAHAFPAIGEDNEFIVGPGVGALRVRMWGGGAGGGWYAPDRWGGGGGYTDAMFVVSPGDKITVQTAKGGQSHAFGDGQGRHKGALGGWPDGGDGAWGDTGGGGGGGSSRLFINEQLAAVAGGGGAASGYNGWGGTGGGGSGGGGTCLGRPGTQTTGGHAGGTPGLPGESNCPEGGTYAENAAIAPLSYTNRHCQRGGFGGIQGVNTASDGGGGGGGYWGGSGGSGDGCSGGGGSGFYRSDAITPRTANGTHGTVAVFSDSSVYPGAPIATGRNSNNGGWAGDGFVHVELLAELPPPPDPSDIPHVVQVTRSEDRDYQPVGGYSLASAPTLGNWLVLMLGSGEGSHDLSALGWTKLAEAYEGRVQPQVFVKKITADTPQVQVGIGSVLCVLQTVLEVGGVSPDVVNLPANAWGNQGWAWENKGNNNAARTIIGDNTLAIVQQMLRPGDIISDTADASYDRYSEMIGTPAMTNRVFYCVGKSGLMAGGVLPAVRTTGNDSDSGWCAIQIRRE